MQTARLKILAIQSSYFISPQPRYFLKFGPKPPSRSNHHIKGSHPSCCPDRIFDGSLASISVPTWDFRGFESFSRRHCSSPFPGAAFPHDSLADPHEESVVPSCIAYGRFKRGCCHCTFAFFCGLRNFESSGHSNLVAHLDTATTASSPIAASIRLSA